jgi:aspartyl-tRNA(Asn)/glutamyl-tRNA(Gln) amidotransferase subunit A
LISRQSFVGSRELIINGTVSCESLVLAFLEKINQNNSRLNAFLEVFHDEALIRARHVDKKIASGNAGKCAGLVVGIKDLLCLQNHKLTCGSKILSGFESQITATCIQRLIDEDAIIIGRQNCDEFGMGSSNENSAYGIVRNPLDESKVPGGSSGGSAAAVAAGMCHISIGSDTGGSIRQPASFCGIVGLKPTYSRISRYGLTAYSSSFDCVGVLSHTIEDAALALEIMAGYDLNDSTSSRKPVAGYLTAVKERKKQKVAVFSEILEAEGISQPVKLALNQSISNIKAAGHEVNIVSFPYLEFLLPTYYILTAAEASANLSRFDGIRYGYREANASNLEMLYKKSRTNGFGKEVLRRILLGTFVLSAGYHDAFYTKAQQVRRLIKEYTEGILTNNDLIIMPTAPAGAFEINSKKDPIQMYLSDIFTVQASVAGLPAITFPVQSQNDNESVGLQLVGRNFEESRILAFSNEISGN